MPAAPEDKLSEADLKALWIISCCAIGRCRRAPATARTPVYNFTGYPKFYDHEGYPANKPPWGTLNCLDLNTGKLLWKVPPGEYPELTARRRAEDGHGKLRRRDRDRGRTRLLRRHARSARSARSTRTPARNSGRIRSRGSAPRRRPATLSMVGSSSSSPRPAATKSERPTETLTWPLPCPVKGSEGVRSVRC